ncbi:MAG: hypothetical protein ACRYG7_00915 [Janthinobacterium lividum]
MKVQRGTPHEHVSPRLNRASEAADAQGLHYQAGPQAAKDELKAAVD